MCSEIYKSYSDWVSFIVNKSLVILRKPWIKDLSYTITLATWWKEPTHWKRTWCCETLKTKGEEAAEDKDSMDMNLSKLWETVKNRGAWHAAVHGVTKSWSLWATHRHTEWITSWPLKLNGEMCVCVCVCVFSHVWLLQPYGLQPSRLLRAWNFSGKNTGAGGHFLFQGIFPTKGSNPHLLCLLRWQTGSLPAEPPGKPMEKHSIVVQTQSGNRVLVKDSLS